MWRMNRIWVYLNGWCANRCFDVEIVEVEIRVGGSNLKNSRKWKQEKKYKLHFFDCTIGVQIVDGNEI